MECGILLRLVGVMNLILFSSRPLLNSQGREPACLILLKQFFALACVQTFTDRFLFKLALIETTMLFILISVWMTWTITQGHNCMRNQKLWCPFLCIDLDAIQYVTTTCGLLKLMLDLFCTRTIPGRELCWLDFVKHMLNIFMFLDTCELICFKLSFMLNANKRYKFKFILNDLYIHGRAQDYRKGGTCAVILL